MSLEAWLTVLGALFTAGVMWGVTKTQTKHIEKKVDAVGDRLTKHIESEHPKLAKEAAAESTEVQVALARISDGMVRPVRVLHL